MVYISKNKMKKLLLLLPIILVDFSCKKYCSISFIPEEGIAPFKAFYNTE
ncbi:MAG: hypothetical protein ACI94Y_002825 [Maribacter sp.]|jgi:hypothetical protein